MDETVLSDQPELDTAEAFRAELDTLLRHFLSIEYTGFSSPDRNPTGNAYQAVQLRDKFFHGFRTLSPSILAGLDLNGARVLDLGCNLGELSRLARKEGAALVDGFECDSFFVQLGQAVNALNGVSRVSLYQCDLTDPDNYGEPYDVVLSFSVFDETQKVLPRIAETCRQLFVVETHSITGNWQSRYIDQVTGHLPHYCILKRTEGEHPQDDGARLLLAFAHDEKEISDCIARRDQALGRDDEDLRFMTLAESDPKFFRVFQDWLRNFPETDIFDLETPVADKLASLGDFTDLPDYRLEASGLIYWLSYLQGFFQFSKSGEIDGSNTYIRYLHRACPDLNFDPFMTTLVESDKDELMGRVRRRFEDTRTAIAGQMPAPILVFNPMPENSTLPSALVDADGGARLSYTHQDGYHRHFSALIAGHHRLPYRMVWHPQGDDFRSLAQESPGLESALFAALAAGLFPKAEAQQKAEMASSQKSNVA
jgi:SAM-dependent methyltransferase